MLKDNNFIELDVSSLLDDSIIDFDLYLFNTEKDAYVLYRGKKREFTSAHREAIIKKKKKIYIKNEDNSNYLYYLKRNVVDIVTDESISIEEKNEYFYNSQKNIMQSIFSEPGSKESVSVTIDISKATTDLILEQEMKFNKLLDLISVDYITHSHCVNVSMFAVNFARMLNLDKDSINDLSLGALMHDVGKANISNDIILKPDKLDAEEWNEIKRHPEYGCEIIQNNEKFNKQVNDIILYHHEKFNGTGYPHGLKGDEIPLLAQITAIADVFDALTTNRVFKRSVGSFEAFDIMKNEMQGSFDEKLLTDFIRMFSKM